MPQSLSKVTVHLVFSTKQRQPFIDDGIRSILHAYMATVLRNQGNTPIVINSVADHIHILVDLARTIAVSVMVEEVKSASSRWIKDQGNAYRIFAWQSGYGVFSVSSSQVDVARQYIERQQEHHQTHNFQDEYRSFLERHDIPFDERYLWE